MTIPSVNPSVQTASDESVLSRFSRQSLSAAPDLTASQALVDRYVSQTAEIAGDWKTVAAFTVGMGLFSRWQSAMSAARGIAVESAAVEANAGARLFHFGISGGRSFAWASSGASALGAGLILTGCGNSETNPDAGPDATAFNAVGAEFPITSNPSTGTNEGLAVALNRDGNFVAAWADVGADVSTTGVFVRAFGASGALGPVGTADQPASSVDVTPSISTNSTGNFVVSWTNTSGPDNPSGVSVRRFNGSGTPVGPTINVITPSVHATLPTSSIVSLEDRGFVLVSNDNSSTCGACAHFFNSDSSPANDVTLVPSGTAVSTVSVGTTTQGQWAWAAIVSGASGHSEIRFQRFNGRSAMGAASSIDIGNLGTAPQVRVATIPNGNSMVVWQPQAFKARFWEATGNRSMPPSASAR
ncbi:MAG: hypothetical protein U1F57_05910 [bacterium]